MSIGFVAIAIVTLAAAVAAISLRNLIHCSLALVVAFVGLAAAYLALHAQFVGFAQILVYVGAVSILIVFAILLTRSGESRQEPIFSGSWAGGVAVALGVLGVIIWAIARSEGIPRETPLAPVATVERIGEALMSRFVLPLEVIGLLLTAALIGAVIIAMQDKERG